MTKKSKNLLTLFGSIIFSGVLLIGTIAIVKINVNVDLSKTNQITGKVISAKIVLHIPTSGQTRLPENVFCISLDNSQESFATYRPNQDYNSLINEINIGDRITIYCRTKYSSEINFDVYQIKKNDKIIQDYYSYNTNHKIVAWMCGIGSLVILSIGLYPYYKNARRKRIQRQKYNG